jgi:hypothetical protein
MRVIIFFMPRFLNSVSHQSDSPMIQPPHEEFMREPAGIGAGASVLGGTGACI